MIRDWLDAQGPSARAFCLVSGIVFLAVALFWACVHRVLFGAWPEWDE